MANDKPIILNSQADIDSLPAEFSAYTGIHIKCRGVEIRFVPRNGIFVARGNSQVTAWGNSQVTAWGNSQVTAWENSQVTAWENSQVTARGNSVTIKELRHSAILINKGVDVTPIKKDRTSKIVNQKQWLHTKKSFLDIYPADDDGFVTLYKVTDENGLDRRTGTIKYEGIVECPDWDHDKDRQCGGGLHLSPEPYLALQYNTGPVKKCRVHRDDFVVYGPDITKVRCRRVEVLEDQS